MSRWPVGHATRKKRPSSEASQRAPRSSKPPRVLSAVPHSAPTGHRCNKPAGSVRVRSRGWMEGCRMKVGSTSH
eukprot:1066864-Rhodomonas_salina.1